MCRAARWTYARRRKLSPFPRPSALRGLCSRSSFPAPECRARPAASALTPSCRCGALPEYGEARAWYFCFFCSCAPFPEIPRRSGVSRAASESCAAVLRVSLCAALVTALLLPWNISEFVGTGGFLSFWLDFIFFWMKALLAAAAASFVSRRAGGVAFVRASALYAALVICGAVCMFIEAGIF